MKKQDTKTMTPTEANALERECRRCGCYPKSSNAADRERFREHIEIHLSALRGEKH